MLAVDELKGAVRLFTGDNARTHFKTALRDDDTGQMKEAQIHSNQTLVADYQSAEIAPPGKGAFDFPPMLVAVLDFWRGFFPLRFRR
ncbi:MAG: hypothetical protein ACUVXF_09785 [Desulfobaccales bacterium]